MWIRTLFYIQTYLQANESMVQTYMRLKLRWQAYDGIANECPKKKNEEKFFLLKSYLNKRWSVKSSSKILTLDEAFKLMCVYVFSNDSISEKQICAFHVWKSLINLKAK